MPERSKANFRYFLSVHNPLVVYQHQTSAIDKPIPMEYYWSRGTIVRVMPPTMYMKNRMIAIIIYLLARPGFSSKFVPLNAGGCTGNSGSF